MASRPLLASLLIFVGATAMQAQQIESLHRRLFSTVPPSAWASDVDDPELLRRLRETGEEPVHGAVLLAAPPSLRQRAALDNAGVKVLYSFGRNAYAVSLPRSPDVLNSLPRRTRATWIRSEDKLGPGIATGEYPAWAFDAQRQRIRVLIEFRRGVRLELLERKLASMGVRATRHGPRTLAATVKPTDPKKIAEFVDVRHVQYGPLPFLPLNDTSRSVTRANLAQQPSFGGKRPTYRLSGEGVKIGICDEGIDENHDDFSEVTEDGEASSTSRIKPPRIGVSSTHGTHVASIAAGSGLASARDEVGHPAFSLRGHAPLATLADFHWFRSNLKQTYDALEKHHTDLTNHSYAQSMRGYDSIAVDLDEIVRGDAAGLNGRLISPKPQVWSAGNHGQSAELAGKGAKETGYHSVFTSAKNTISVGSIDSMTGRLSRFSSLGPTFDGRIKPDLVAPGCRNSNPSSHKMMKAAEAQGSYYGICGTSMAAPVVTGIVALMMHQYRLTYGKHPNLLPSTYKAMLVHTAEDQTKVAAYTDEGEFVSPDTLEPVLYHAGPDFATGWGLVDAERAREIVTHADRWKEGKITTKGEEHQWCLGVPEGSAEVRATIAWDDAPGDTEFALDHLPRGDRRPSEIPLLKNDLDLELVRPPPDSSVVLPWTIDPPGREFSRQSEIKPAYRGEDHRNNVEMVTWCLPSAGTWRVRVRGTWLDDGMKQRYSLVTSHPISPCP